MAVKAILSLIFIVFIFVLSSLISHPSHSHPGDTLLFRAALSSCCKQRQQLIITAPIRGLEPKRVASSLVINTALRPKDTVHVHRDGILYSSRATCINYLL